MRSLSVLVVLLALTSLWAGVAPAAAPKGDDEFRAGWLALLAPPAGPVKGGQLQAKQEARLAALPHFRAALDADPDNAAYRTTLIYAYLAAGKYQLAKDAVDAAISHNKRDPLLFLLRGQAEAALTQLEQETASARVERVLRSFDDAARLDPKNSLALLQAASVAFDAGRSDLGLKKVGEALKRPEMTLYRLSLPGDLNPNRTVALKQWQNLQIGQWMEMIARCENVVRALLKSGAEREESGDLDGADARYGQALAVAKLIGEARPNLIIFLNTGMNAMEDSYLRLLDLAKKRQSRKADEWEGELGILQIGRGELHGILQGYLKALEDNPPQSVDALLALEAQSIGHVMLGVGLTPEKDPGPMSLPKQPKS